MTPPAAELVLAPFRATRYGSSGDLGTRLCPPYDVIPPSRREELAAASTTGAVRLVLPQGAEAALGGGDPYAGARALLDAWVDDGVLTVDAEPALYVYELAAAGHVTRGLVGSVALRDPDDGVILPHEDTMAGPVADRLALMRATAANLEPIFLVYDGGGATTALVAGVDLLPTLAEARTPDGVTHRLWAITDPQAHAAVARDLAPRSALIADGHHRYATYRQLQADHGGEAGPWDFGLTLLVDTSAYGPQVHPIHRVVGLTLDRAITTLQGKAGVSEPMSLAQAQQSLAGAEGFAVVLATDEGAVVVSDLDPAVVAAGLGDCAGTPLGRLDVTIVHRVLVQQVWGLIDTEEVVGYAHEVGEAIAAAGSDRTAVLLRATPIEDVAAVAAAGQRMPRKSTSFTPKPASGMVIRRFVDG